MSFWNNPAVEPKRQYRWVFSMAKNFSSGWMVKSVTKPTAEISITDHKYFGHNYKYPGSVKWNDIDIVLVDPFNPDSVAALAKIVKDSGYNPPNAAPTGPGGLSTISKLKSTNAIGAVFIRQVDAEGAVIEEWTLTNPLIKNVDFGGTLAYDQEGLIEVKMTVAYDWAQLTKAGITGGDRFWVAGSSR